MSASKRKRTGGGSNVEPDAAVKCSHGAGGPAVGRRKATVSPKKEGGGIAAREGSLLREPRQRRRKQREDSLCCGDQDMENTRKREGEGGRSDRDYRDGGSGGSSNEDHGEGGDEEEPHSECTAQTAEESSEEEKEHGQARNAGEKGGDLEEISSDVDGDVEIPETMQEMSADEDEEGDDEAAIQESNGISEYELQRLERIRKNQAFMASIGLGDSKPPPSIVAATPSAGVAAARKKKRSRPVSREKERAPLAPVRRSTRAKGVEAVNYGEVRSDFVGLPWAMKAQAAVFLQIAYGILGHVRSRVVYFRRGGFRLFTRQVPALHPHRGGTISPFMWGHCLSFSRRFPAIDRHRVQLLAWGYGWSIFMDC